MPVMSRPRSSTRPALGFTKPVMRLISVLLPEPLGPITPSASPRRSSNETSFTACTAPKFLHSPRTRKSGSSAIRRLLDGDHPLELRVLPHRQPEQSLGNGDGEDQEHPGVEDDAQRPELA